MSPAEALLSALLTTAWAWRIGSSAFSSYSISEVITPKCFGTPIKAFLSISQMLFVVVLDLIPLQAFPRVSLAHRLVSIPSQLYTLYYANKYIGPTLDSRRVTVVVALVSIVCILETIYMIKLDWSRIE